MKAWLILAAQSVASWVDGYRDGRHLATDPACVHHVAPRPGSRLDRFSRGVSCVPCMVRAAFGEPPCRRAPEGWFCTRTADHEGPCAAVAVRAGGQAHPDGSAT